MIHVLTEAELSYKRHPFSSPGNVHASIPRLPKRRINWTIQFGYKLCSYAKCYGKEHSSRQLVNKLDNSFNLTLPKPTMLSYLDHKSASYTFVSIQTIKFFSWVTFPLQTMVLCMYPFGFIPNKGQQIEHTWF